MKNHKFSAAVRRNAPKAAAAGLFALLSSAAFAAGHADDFSMLYTQLTDWTTGSLGKSISLIFLLIGLGIGCLRGSIIGAISCLAAALSLVIAPDIIAAIFGSATI